MITHSVFPSRSHRFLTAVLVAALGLGFSLTAQGQSVAPAGGPPGMPVWSAGGVRASGSGSEPAQTLAATAVAGGASDTKTAGGLNQGLKMHGHWVIDIKNADGTLVQHHEFENSIAYDGKNYLIGLMSGYAAAGPWAIYFTSASGTAATSPCNTAAYPYCAIVYSTTTMPGIFECSVYTCAPGLTITPAFGGVPTLNLSGSITATQAGSIGYVGTGFSGCGVPVVAPDAYPAAISAITPTACYASTTSQFGGTGTSTGITPISVASGQIIQVTVTLSLS